ncbi:MAG: cytochrome c3 family protein, partial [Chlorobiaceae bacterium]
MKPLFAFIISAIMLVALAVAFPEVLLTPGSLLKGHHDVEKNCLNCHTPFRGVKSVTCTNCHKQNDISVKTVSGTLLQKNSKKILFHQGLSSGSCIECHTDHKGINALKALKPFKHSILSSSLRNSCVSCHSNQKPEDKLHRSLQGSCAECHNTNKWKPASFNHR